MRYRPSMYNRLFTKILDSSIWLEPLHVRVVWITFLAAMDEDGFCSFACPANVARRAGVTDEQCEESLRTLCGPDPNSSDTDNEGRRLERVPGGYLVLNAVKYKAAFNREIQREQTRKRVAKFRQSHNVTERNDSVTVSNDPVTQSESYSESESESDFKLQSDIPKRRARSEPIDEVWMDDLQKREVYKSLDVRAIYGKMCAWCEVNNQTPTRRRLINWLNRQDKPMTAATNRPDTDHSKGW